MAYYDPAMEALIAEMLHILAPDTDPDTLGYIDQLRALQTAMVDLLSGKTVVASPQAQPSEGWSVTPEEEVVLRMALGKLDAKAGDQSLEGAEVVRRLLSCMDKELMKWVSAMEQPIGPSGDAVVAGFAPRVG